MKKKNLIVTVGIFLLVCCQTLVCRAQEEQVMINKIYVSGVQASLDQLPTIMSEIYQNVNREAISFDSCKFMKQEDEVCKLISYAHRGDTLVYFAVLATCQNDAALIKSTPTYSCTCYGNCTVGCEPYFVSKTNQWICTDCEKTTDQIPYCTKSVTAVVLPNEPIKSSTKENIIIVEAGQCITSDALPALMTKIYKKECSKNTTFDVCEVVFQEDGHVLLVAHGQEDALNVHFAVPLIDHKDYYEIEETPLTTCTCMGECQTGCNPVYHGEYSWSCTSCTYPESMETTCNKSITARLPESRKK